MRDVVRPHSCLHYVWDEPLALPRHLLVQLPSGQSLGGWRLDELQPARTHVVGCWLSRQVRV